MYKDEFKNELIEGIHASRYIASWRKVYNGPRSLTLMGRWLSDLEINGRHLSKDEIQFIINFSDNGKLELQDNASRWLKRNWQ